MKLWAMVTLLAVGCTRPAATPPRDLPRRIAVLPPNNRTGDPLLVSGASLLEKYAMKTARVGVPDVVASEARLQLARRGFEVVPEETVDAATEGRAPGSPEAAVELAAHGKLDVPVLYLEIRRWEADAPTHPAYVIVGLTAHLVDPSTRRTVWSAERAAHPVATPGEVAIGPAYVTAARKAVEELLAPLGPERTP
jgi:hypothetical protein